ncbi:MAG: WYL domain-containing protein [Deltaproteobacteria bacterium]|nr:WYL domain-containing protein [Deltaproteobacteria bacterium]
MSEFLYLERLLWFDARIRANRYPNARTLAEKFEICNRSAQSCIERFRERFNLPLEYDPLRHGYTYSDPTYQIPFIQPHQQEILALLIAGNLLSHAAGGFISRAIARFGKHLLAQTEQIGLSEKRLAEAFSGQWHGFAPAPAEVFRKTADALLKNHLLSMDYHSPQQPNEPTRRMVEPHHLQHYMGTWYLIAFCRNKKEWRKFSLARMARLKVEKTGFAPRDREEWRQQLEGGFGVIQGGELTLVRLRFAPSRAPYIREQHWHPQQSVEERPDGGLILSFPVADFREIKLEVQRYGAEVEVLEPQGLRDEIAREIRAMSKIYD